MKKSDKKYFGIHITDSETGRGIPGITVSMVNGVYYVTDSAGYAAFYEPDAMNCQTFFYIRCPGYKAPDGGFGFDGFSTIPKEGETYTLTLQRENTAERLYRITGQGIYGDSVRLSLKPPTKNPVNNSQVAWHTGTHTSVYNKRLYWFWNSTADIRSSDIKNMVTGAFSLLPGDGGLSPSDGVDLTYFTDASGCVRPMVKNLNDGSVKIELTSLMASDECMIAGFASYCNENKVISRGILIYNDDEEIFELKEIFDSSENRKFADGQAVGYSDAGASDVCAISRDNEKISIGGAASAWNGYRKKWMLIGHQLKDNTETGRIWYAESDSAEGPWTDAGMIADQVCDSLDNIIIHPYFSEAGGKIIYFDGTYIRKGIKNTLPLDEFPYYEKNRLMYRVDTDYAAGLTCDLTVHPPQELPDGEIYNTCYFKIETVSAKNGRGVPMAEVKTNSGRRFYSDSSGYIAFDEPGLMNQDVYFTVTSDGYTYPKDKNGAHGTVVNITPGGSVKLELIQNNIADRMYRITGHGIYKDTVLLGLPSPIKNPLSSGRVAGQDSTQATVCNGKVYYFWGDTAGIQHPLGNFKTSAAVAELPENGGLDPDIGIDLSYFERDDGFVKAMAPDIKTGGLVWVSNPVIVKDKNGKDQMLVPYASLEGLGKLKARGMLIFDEESHILKLLFDYNPGDDNAYKYTGGYTELVRADGKEYWVMTLPNSIRMRVVNDYDKVTDPRMSEYEFFTPLSQGSVYDQKNPENNQLERDSDGNLLWGWKRNTQPLGQKEEKALIDVGLIKDDDIKYYQYIDADTGEDVTIHTGSIYWNRFKKKWIMIGTEIHGTSLLGEIRYSESDTLEGPWRYAKKIVTHKKFAFYNPIQHHYYAKDSYIYFEATYTDFLTHAMPTPAYNYNQIMYRLDLSDSRIQFDSLTDK